MLKLFHLENHEIAKKLQLSQNDQRLPREDHREIKYALKNILAMTRVKSAIVD